VLPLGHILRVSTNGLDGDVLSRSTPRESRHYQKQ
jgi:hypothetical protein